MRRPNQHCPECEGCEGTIEAERAFEEHMEHCGDLCEEPCDILADLENPCTEEDKHRICFEHDPA